MPMGVGEASGAVGVVGASSASKLARWAEADENCALCMLSGTGAMDMATLGRTCKPGKRGALTGTAGDDALSGGALAKAPADGGGGMGRLERSERTAARTGGQRAEAERGKG
jgi:hypothetical protein